jgi:single-strand DNA-binding protein
MNNIQLLGRITKDLELKTTTTGKPVCSFDIAVTRKFDKEITYFIPCVAWNKTCETMCKFVKKGQLIAIDGSLYTRKYEDKNGNNRTAYEVNVNNFYFAESKKSPNVDVGVDPLQEVANKVNTFNAGNNSSSGDMFADVLDNSGDLPF